MEQNIENKSRKIVCFRYEPDTMKLVAVFPFEGESKGFCHVIYQNGEEFNEELNVMISSTKAAKFEDFAESFYEELNKRENGNLRLLNLNDEGTIEYHRPPTKEEISFGYGAEHYIDVPFIEVIDKDMNIKRNITREGLKYQYR